MQLRGIHIALALAAATLGLAAASLLSSRTTVRAATAAHIDLLAAVRDERTRLVEALAGSLQRDAEHLAALAPQRFATAVAESDRFDWAIRIDASTGSLSGACAASPERAGDASRRALEAATASAELHALLLAAIEPRAAGDRRAFELLAVDRGPEGIFAVAVAPVGAGERPEGAVAVGVRGETFVRGLAPASAATDASRRGPAPPLDAVEVTLVGPDGLQRSTARGFLEDPQAYLAAAHAAGERPDRIEWMRRHGTTATARRSATPMALRALGGERGRWADRDALGRAVVGAYGPVVVAGDRWGLVAEMPRTALHPPTAGAGQLLLPASLLVLALLATVAGVVTASPFRADPRAAPRVR